MWPELPSKIVFDTQSLLQLRLTMILMRHIFTSANEIGWSPSTLKVSNHHQFSHRFALSPSLPFIWSQYQARLIARDIVECYLFICQDSHMIDASFEGSKIAKWYGPCSFRAHLTIRIDACKTRRKNTNSVAVVRGRVRPRCRSVTRDNKQETLFFLFDRFLFVCTSSRRIFFSCEPLPKSMMQTQLCFAFFLVLPFLSADLHPSTLRSHTSNSIPLHFWSCSLSFSFLFFFFYPFTFLIPLFSFITCFVSRQNDTSFLLPLLLTLIKINKHNMGIIDFDCMTTDPGSSTFYGLTNTKGYGETDYNYNIVLAKSNTNPTSLHTTSWSFASSYSSKNLSIKDGIPTTAGCAVDSKGIVTFIAVHYIFAKTDPYSKYITAVRYDPAGVANPNLSQGTGSWSIMSLNPLFGQSTFEKIWLFNSVVGGIETLQLAYLTRLETGFQPAIVFGAYDVATATFNPTGRWDMVGGREREHIVSTN